MNRFVFVVSLLLALLASSIQASSLCTGVYCGTGTCDPNTGTCICPSPLSGPTCSQYPTYSCSNMPPIPGITLTNTFPSSSSAVAASLKCPAGYQSSTRYMWAKETQGHTFYTYLHGLLYSSTAASCVFWQSDTTFGALSVEFQCVSSASCNIKYTVSLECVPSATFGSGTSSTNNGHSLCQIGPVFCPSATQYYVPSNATNAISPGFCCQDGTMPNYNINTAVCTCGLLCPNNCNENASPSSHGSCNGATGTCTCRPGWTGNDCSVVATTVASSTAAGATSATIATPSSTASVVNENVQNSPTGGHNAASFSHSISYLLICVTIMLASAFLL